METLLIEISVKDNYSGNFNIQYFKSPGKTVKPQTTGNKLVTAGLHLLSSTIRCIFLHNSPQKTAS